VRRRRGRLAIEAEIPTSSTGDIAFLLIIFFMVTATFAASRGLSFQLPDQAPEGNEGDDAVLIEIRDDGTIAVDCRVMAAAETLDYLEPRLTRNPRKPVVLYAHEGASYQQLVEVYEWLYRAPERGLADVNVQIATPDIIDSYIQTFGLDPFRDHCAGRG